MWRIAAPLVSFMLLLPFLRVLKLLLVEFVLDVPKLVEETSGPLPIGHPSTTPTAAMGAAPAAHVKNPMK